VAPVVKLKAQVKDSLSPSLLKLRLRLFPLH
jgi:hypothetical protein